MASGAPTYIGGKSCSAGHPPLRATANGACVECGRARARAQYWKNPQARRLASRAYVAANKDRVAARNHVYWRTDEFRALNRARQARRYKDPGVRINARMSARMAKFLGGGRNSGSWSTLVGYGLDELRVHLERQFLPGMSWENIGLWHIDHVIALSLFSFSDVDDPEFRAAWAITNLRPLWALDNLKKHARREHLL